MDRSNHVTRVNLLNSYEIRATRGDGWSMRRNPTGWLIDWIFRYTLAGAVGFPYSLSLGAGISGIRSATV
ncbi:MAG: hypothetical protein DMG57_20065 [Acidobacteria bacterium]|nr:MAG: hypothetical protein DMG57_20065 [Acidobacteriota bacterium]